MPRSQNHVGYSEGQILDTARSHRSGKARGQVEKLTPSLLARAFAGQLVPQDPTDEPAEKLLERIRTSRDSLQAREGKRKRGHR